MHFVRKLALILAVASLSAACGGSEPGDSDNSTGGMSASGGSTGTGGNAGAPVSIGDLLPWKEGNTWTYSVTDDAGNATQKRTTVGPLEPVGGTGPNKDRMAHKVTTHKDDTGDGLDLDETASWQAKEGERVVRYREQAFVRGTQTLDLEEHWTPSKLHVDSSAAHTAIGATWLESYKETKLPVGATPIYDAQASDRWFVERREMVTVPAGTFDALVLRKVSVAAAEKTYWYAPGVGKVKETGGQTEELIAYELK
jgi:hypothetical protein